MEVESCRWCEGDGYLPGESAGKRCRYCGGTGKQPAVDKQSEFVPGGNGIYEPTGESRW